MNREGPTFYPQFGILSPTMMQSDARNLGGFNRDILEWNIPEEVLAVLLKNSVTTSEIRQ